MAKKLMTLLASTKTIYAGEEYLSVGYFKGCSLLQRIWLSKILEIAKKVNDTGHWNGDYIRKRLKKITKLQQLRKDEEMPKKTPKAPKAPKAPKKTPKKPTKKSK